MQRVLARASYRRTLGAPKSSLQGLSAWRLNPSDSLESRRSVYTWRVPIPLTKIVATIGPVSEQFEPMQEVCVNGTVSSYCHLPSLSESLRVMLLLLTKRQGYTPLTYNCGCSMICLTINSDSYELASISESHRRQRGHTPQPSPSSICMPTLVSDCLLIHTHTQPLPHISHVHANVA